VTQLPRLLIYTLPIVLRNAEIVTVKDKGINSGYAAGRTFASTISQFQSQCSIRIMTTDIGVQLTNYYYYYYYHQHHILFQH